MKGAKKKPVQEPKRVREVTLAYLREVMPDAIAVDHDLLEIIDREVIRFAGALGVEVKP